MLIELGQNGAVLKSDADETLGEVEVVLSGFSCLQQLLELLLNFFAIFVALLHLPGAWIRVQIPLVGACQVSVNAEFRVFANVLQDIFPQLNLCRSTSNMSAHLVRAFNALSFYWDFRFWLAIFCKSAKVSLNFSLLSGEYLDSSRG